MRDPLFAQLLHALSRGFVPQADKGEETPESTLQALWLAAAGEPRGVDQALSAKLPPLDAASLLRLEDMLAQRRAGVPLAHITGRQWFMGIDLHVSAAALIPRRETEILGHAALGLMAELARDRPPLTVLDVCTGAGNLAFALAHHHPECRVYASDLCTDAIELARLNRGNLDLDSRVELRAGDLFEPFETELRDSVDLISCNPPYISSDKVSCMPTEISRFEPSLAFDGGPFGVTILRRLIKESPRLLRSRSWLCFEVGLGQGPGAERLLGKSRDFADVRSYADERGNIRALAARTH